MLVKDAMTLRPVTVGLRTPLSRAMALRDQYSVTMLPVVTPTDMIIGVRSEADVIRDAVPTDRRRHAPRPARRAGRFMTGSAVRSSAGAVSTSTRTTSRTSMRCSVG